MVTLQSADSALKSFYLNAITDALNMKTNPLLAKIQQTTANVVGKEVKKAIRIGVSGGIGAGTETGDLPSASTSDYAQLTATLKNLYGTIEISDKAIRASANNEGAFVNLLNDEMESLVKSASFNFGRMLFGDGTGKVAAVTSATGNTIKVDNTAGIAEGMLISICDNSGAEVASISKRKIIGVDRVNNSVTVDGASIVSSAVPSNPFICLQGSGNQEMTGLGAIFSDNAIYGLDRTASVMRPYKKTSVGEISESTIQKAMDTIEEISGDKVDYIVCSWGVRRALCEYYKKNQVSLPTMELEGGVKAISFNGIPVIADRFCPKGTMYLLNTNHFKIHQLCDWQWLEGEDGKILKQVPGKPVYTATLVKYAELLCENPSAQGALTGITEA
ncbi:MAG: phage major capsid protein [Clostridia bacterium]|nr:phage major capsid protein [Clostridia bacterium]